MFWLWCYFLPRAFRNAETLPCMSENAFRRADEIGAASLLGSESDDDGGRVGQGDLPNHGGPGRREEGTDDTPDAQPGGTRASRCNGLTRVRASRCKAEPSPRLRSMICWWGHRCRLVDDRR